MTSAQQDLIPPQERSRLKRDFRKHLRNEVRLRMYTQRPSPIAIPGRECRYCPEVQQLMEELAGLSPNLSLETVEFHIEPEKAREDGVARIPAVLVGPESGGRLRFYGRPMGYQMLALIDSLKSFSRGSTRLSVNTRRQLRRVDRPVHMQVFVAPGSETAAGMAFLALAMAVESASIQTDVIDVEEFPDLGRRYGVRQMPLTIINEFTTVSGMVPEDELLEKVLLAGQAIGA